MFSAYKNGEDTWWKQQQQMSIDGQAPQQFY